MACQTRHVKQGTKTLIKALEKRGIGITRKGMLNNDITLEMTLDKMMGRPKIALGKSVGPPKTACYAMI